MKVLCYRTGKDKYREIPLKEVKRVVECKRVYRYPGLPPFILDGSTIYPVVESWSEYGYAILLKENKGAIISDKIKGGEKC